MPGCWKLSWCLCGEPGRPKISSPIHLLLKPPDAELLGHTFKQKQFRKSRPCNLCHQPVKNIGSSCRVCKYACHRTCEPKVWRACRQQLGNSSFKSGSEASEPLINRSSPSKKQTSMIPETRNRFSGSPSRREGSSTAIMDLSFVTERILALSFPPEIESSVYRDALHQAANMLQTKHGDNYMVFNLSLPRKEIGFCNPRVLDVGWPNQLAPPLERLCSVCRALDSWLQADPQHVAVLHSRSGLQRVGVVVAAYCEYTGLSCPPNQDQSLDRFSMKRFLNERVGGLRSPSDKRYVEYFAGLLSGSIQVNSSPLFLDHLTVVGIPAFQSNGGCRAFFKVYQGSVPVHTSSIYNLHDSARHFTVPMGERGLALRGDILVKCYHRHRQSSKDGRETVFSLQFHTCAVTAHTLVFQRQDLDDACQDLRFPLDGSVRLHFSTGSESRLGVNETHTRYTVESSTGDAVVRWDSYDTVADSCSEQHDVSSAATLSASHRLAHIYGPLDGSLYAKVLKSSAVKTSPNSPPLIVEFSQQLKDSAIEPRSVSRFSDPNSTSSGGGGGGGSGGDHYHHHHHHHHHRLPSQFLNSPHVASTDSGISSAGVVRSAGGSSGNHRGDLGSAGSTSVSPPHSGHSAESSVAVFDSPSTPSPVQQQLQQHQSLQQQHQQQQLRKMPSIVETRAEVHHDHHAMKPNGTGEGGGVSPASPTLTATAELDQLLSGMLMNVQNIPDIRPSQRHFQLGDDIDVDSIQVKFDLAAPASAPAPIRDTTDSSGRKNSNTSLGYVYESDTVRRATHQPLTPPNTTTNTASDMINLFNSSASGAAQQTVPLKSHNSIQSSARTAKDIPYHAREDSKPFTYGMMSNGAHRQDNGNVGNSANGTTSPTPTEMAPISPPTQRRNWKDSSSNKAMSNSGGSSGGGNQAKAKALESPSLVRKFSTGSEPSGLTPSNTSRSAPRIPPPSIAEPTSPRPMRKLSEAMLLNGSSGTPSNVLPVATSSPRLDSTRTRSASANSDFATKSPHAPSTTPQLQHYISLEESIQDISTSPDSSRMSNEMAGQSWLQRQQQKLRDRKDSMRRAERHPQEARLLSELRLSHQFKGQQQLQQQLSRPGDDGYLSDVTLFSELDMVNTSREGSPDIRSLYATPLHINTANTYSQQYQQSKFGNIGGVYNRTLSTSSNPGSPLLTHRSSSTERSVRYPGSGESQQRQQQQEQSRMALTRQKSDISYDRERPFVAVKRAHEQLKTLTNGRQDSVMSWNSSLSGEDLSNRPVTPGFPVVPRTPYLNVQNSGRQSVDSVSPTSSHSTGGTGLPPKSPTTQRRNQAGLQTNSFSPSPSSAKILRKWPSNSSVSSKERSPSPSPSSAYLGQSQSRRSSVQSVGGLSEPQEVSAAHVNFVKDTSRFWYKPNIARENAIAMLKDQIPGTFIVRDSNSFPGAFGLALKVATPPPHAAGKNTADPSAELVRHFLIEPTSKGVRIKGCSNEPVFGSLSALIYQHSVTPLALPTKLVLPDGDLLSISPVNSALNTNPTIQLLTQGAACNLLFLFTMDTESLTGPQAIQRSMTHLLDAKPLPTPTVVHFKVSSLGITLTDNERKLFFRRHYPVSTVSYCGLDPEDRRWNQRSEETGLPISSNRCFGFIARKPASKTDNQCHLFAELEAEQPATAIVNFVKLMMTSSTTTHNKNNV